MKLLVALEDRNIQVGFLKYEALVINTFIDYLIISFKFKLKLAKCKVSLWKATLMHFMLYFIHAEDD